MSQVDILNYWPLLCWFIVIFCLFYGLIFLYLVPSIFKFLKVQELFFTNHIWVNICYKIFINFLRNLTKFIKILSLIQNLCLINKIVINNYLLLNLNKKK